MATPSSDQIACIRRIKRCSPTAYYDILDLEAKKTTCTTSEIKKSYYKLSLLLHPDKNKHDDAPESFTKVSKAFEVLSDPALRKQHDVTGGDPQSRFGGAPPPGRTPFGNAFGQQTGGPIPPGFGGGFNGVDVTPEELFRQFFGGGGGAFGGSPFGQSFVFNMGGGPGVRVNNFGGQRRQQQTRTETQAQPTSGLSVGSIQVLIFLLPFLFSFLSFLFSGSTPAGPGFRFDSAAAPYTYPQTSHRLRVPYWVDQAETSLLTKPKLKEFDRHVEVQYISKLENECQVQRNHRERLTQDAQGWLFPNEEKMKRAKAYPMPSCSKLRDMRSR